MESRKGEEMLRRKSDVGARRVGEDRRPGSRESQRGGTALNGGFEGGVERCSGDGDGGGTRVFGNGFDFAVMLAVS